MSLQRYHQKRDFGITPEPRGRVASSRGKHLSFVVQKHAASHLHYDFRLELGGVLLSWAVPKGPSLDTADKRLAMHVEDHPLEYGGFEGTIPAHQYGGGTVMVWDRGTWIPHGDPAQDYAAGRLKFELDGEKLKGGWMLVRSHGGKYGGKRAGDVWFLIKERDAFARADDPIAESAPDSVQSGRSLEEIASDGDRVWQSDRSVKQNLRAGAVAPRRAAPTSSVKTAKTAKAANATKGAAKAAKQANAQSTANNAPGALQRAMPAGARRAKLPAQLAPMLATLVKETPSGEGWLHEIKYDGYRMLSRIERGKVRIQSRNGKDWTSALPTIAKALSLVPLASAWLDGELAVADARGHTSFQQLQNALSSPSSPSSAMLTYFVFDLPFANGYDLRGVTLRERKAMLRALFDPPPDGIRYGVEIEAPGSEVLRQACTLGLEGIVSKRLDSTYAGVRSREWLKVKCGRRQEMVIGGFTDPAGAREHFGALLMGVYDDGKLRYSGRVGTGFDDTALKKLHAQLVRIEIDAPAFDNPPRGARARDVHWVKPVLVAEVAFTEWTDDGTLRHPAFLGLRVDEDASRVTREREQPADTAKPFRATGAATRNSTKSTTTGANVAKPRSAANVTKAKTAVAAATRAKTKAAGTTTKKAAVSATKPNASPVRPDADAGLVAGVRLSNPGKLYFPEANISKRDVALYYEAVAPRLLPHLAGRPLALVRCPDGWKGQCFYQKHAATALGAEVGRIEVRESKGPTDYAEVHSAAGLAALVQWGVVEIHPWGSCAPKLDRPDRLIFDFDPDDAVAWDALVDSVQALRKLLDEMALQAFIKTTGGKGLHVVVPIRPSVDWDTAKRFTRAVAELMANAFPDRFVATVSKLRRKDRIYIDYLRNAQGSTAVAPYGVRARADAPVAMPIEWKELNARADLRFAHFNLRNAPARIAAQRADPWREFGAQAVALTAAIRKRVGAA